MGSKQPATVTWGSGSRAIGAAGRGGETPREGAPTAMAESENELAERAQARVGTVLCGKYRIDRLIGVGGMACVYAATHRNSRRVAVKMLHPELSMSADVRRRFLREGHAATAVQHPGAVVVLDDDVAEDGAAFLVMELLEGKVIEQLWEESGGRLPAKLVLAIARELCSVLDAAHHGGIVHRDIKPENLFLTRDGVLKVLDFGLAQLRTTAVIAKSKPKTTITGMVFGTPAFMAPEQAEGRASRIDARTDVWAVGATMFTLLSGRIVHEGETAQRIVILTATKPPRSLAAVLPDADPSLVEVVDRALAFDQEQRWRSAAAMRAAISAVSVKMFGDAAPPLPRIAAGRGGVPELRAAGIRAAIAQTVPAEAFDPEASRVDTDGANDMRADAGPAGPPLPRRPTPVTATAGSPSAGAPNWSSLRRAIGAARSLFDRGSVMDSSDEVTRFREPRRGQGASSHVPALPPPDPVTVGRPARPYVDFRPAGGSVTPTVPDPRAAPMMLGRFLVDLAETVVHRVRFALFGTSAHERLQPTAILVTVAVLASTVLVLIWLRVSAHGEARSAPPPPASTDSALAGPETAGETVTTGSLNHAPPEQPTMATPAQASRSDAADAGIRQSSIAATAPDEGRGGAAAPARGTSRMKSGAAPIAPHPPAATSGARSSPTAECSPPYELDGTGKKHWKLECL
jgi:serine/threonine-protein kinase